MTACIRGREDGDNVVWVCIYSESICKFFARLLAGNTPYTVSRWQLHPAPLLMRPTSILNVQVVVHDRGRLPME